MILKMFLKQFFIASFFLDFYRKFLSRVNTAVHFCWPKNLTYRCFKTVDKLIEVRIHAA